MKTDAEIYESLWQQIHELDGEDGLLVADCSDKRYKRILKQVEKDMADADMESGNQFNEWPMPKKPDAC